ncbi:MAG: SDR family oxidoreductase [Bacteroidota bacterium]
MKLQGKTIAVTGAASGIGRALAVELAGQCQGLALCDINAERLAETAELVRNAGAVVLTQRVDTADRAQVEAFARASLAHFGAVDGIVNNAGVALGRASVLDVPMEALEWIVGINLWGMIYGTKAFLPHLITRPEAAVVNISSLFGLMGVPEQAGYCTTKFAIRGFNESLRMELRYAHPQVKVVSVHPGGIATRIARDARRVTEMDQQVYAADIANFDRFLRMPPEKAARKIVRGVRRNRGRVLIGYDAKLMDIFIRLLPLGYQRFVANRANAQKEKVMRKFRERGE